MLDTVEWERVENLVVRPIFFEVLGSGDKLLNETCQGVELVWANIFRLVEYELVTGSICGLEKLGSSDTLHLPQGHDAHAISEDVRLVHVVSGQQHRPANSQLGKQVPQLSTSERVHSYTVV